MENRWLLDLTTVGFADRTRSKFTIDCCWPLFNFNFNSSKMLLLSAKNM